MKAHYDKHKLIIQEPNALKNYKIV